MQKRHFNLIALLLLSTISYGQVIISKIVDDGGSGQYKAIAATEESLADFVVYRPENIAEAVKNEGKSPVLVWTNGG